MKPLKRKRGRPPIDGETRVRLYSGGPHVKRSTRDFLALCGPLYGLPMGRVLDALVELCVSQGTTFRLPLKGRYSYLQDKTKST
jgi:hypothetical protein